MVLRTEVPPRMELVRRAEELVPLLRSHATWTDEHRRLHDEVVEAMSAAGIFRMRVPARYGGYESDAGTVSEVISRISGSDGSAGWNTAVWSISNWIAGLFPDEAQDEVFAEPDVRVCGVLSPTAGAEPTNGGFVVNGRWRFISGALHSQWQAILAMGPAPDGSQWPVMALVPISDLEIVDDWHTAGLRGTGSVSTVAKQVFVPRHRVLPMVAVLAEQYASKANAGSPMFRQPLVPTGCATFAAAAVGLAKAALDAFLDRLGERKITYTEYASQREAPITHFQVAEAAMKTEEAEFHGRRLVELLDGRYATGEAWQLVDRVRARAHLGRVFQLTKEAVGVLKTGSGGTSIYDDVPIQRIDRDIQTLNMHALMHPNTNAELYGRILCGLAPNTMYL
ncbi:acyl-CoA dehydrogenase family protein [Plantactinospora sp. B6F1]|uniref:acyl-CoA dehydrogenase family protein n=1 Tax=Plantactinospora sp. B6F1 TaxID=3158971 RepID=UPI00102CFF41